ncbi:phenoloxidase-activating factor 2-like [Palaemon carinicauda]|uniref:phenoloxidase-activating factor 2-like n=1 Tax=Palaemon carinicauda TaxID=392227 RepID=UPI0035B5C30C
MRLLVSLLAFVAFFGDINCQNNEATRLGLVSSDIGVPPVPGGQFENPQNTNSPKCFCLPVNQACPNQPIASLLRVANQGGQCTNAEQKLCCPGSGTVPIPIARPSPIVPNPFQVSGSCGVSNPIPLGRSNFAEADFGEYPWMAVVLDLAYNYLGGGVLIASDWVLTAAHKLSTNQIIVRLGEHNVRSQQDHPQYPHLEVLVDRVIVHSRYNARTLANDIALLHLAQPVNTNAFPHIGTACLPEQGQLFFTQSQSCWVSGWGKDAFSAGGSFQTILKEVDVPMVDPFVCQAKLQRSRLGNNFSLDTNSFICAGGVAGKDACTGDGGAPLVCPSSRGWTVVGLVAWGIGCATGELPGVYVNVPNYIDFIRQYVRVQN